MMDPPKITSSLFQVYLRLRPPPALQAAVLTEPERFLSVEPAAEESAPTHITLNPPNDNRRRAVERFGFTKVFQEDASQLDLFNGTGLIELVKGVLGGHGEGRDGLLATLGVTGSGKSHTILGSKNQRGMTQLVLDLLFRSIGEDLLDPITTTSLHATVAASDPSEAQVLSAQGFLDNYHGGDSAGGAPSRAGSVRAETPMRVRHDPSFHPSSTNLYPKLRDFSSISTQRGYFKPVALKLPSYMTPSTSQHRTNTKDFFKGDSNVPPQTPRRNPLQRPSVLPQLPDITSVTVPTDANAEYSIVISMYEVYNDRIFDLLTPASRVASTKDYRRRPLLFKPTEQSPDRKVVAGLRKVICGSVRDALMVLDAGLQERRVAGTGSNSVSSRSHGFFSVEVKKRRRGRGMTVSGWTSNALTIVDLAGSERARDAKTQGATLAEAGKINESLMYLGQCLQMQSDAGTATKPTLGPFRQCKLTELLFSNSFPSHAPSTPHTRNPQRGIMIVTADPHGDYNATSQILRYSALAREITIPRVPSAGLPPPPLLRRFTPTDTERTTMEIAALEIARMSDEIDGLRAALTAAHDDAADLAADLRLAEARLATHAEQAADAEAELRVTICDEMEARMQADLACWKASWEAERDRSDEHLDRKLDILSRGIEDDEDKENSPAKMGVGAGVVEEVEEENRRLRLQVVQLQRELAMGRSPSKRMVLGEARAYALEGEPQERKSGSPTKKVRKLTAKKWDLLDEGEMF